MGYPQSVVFLHSVGMKAMGSKIMRSDQLADIANHYLGDRFMFEVRAAPYRPEDFPEFIEQLKGSIVIVLKNTLKRIPSDERNRLRQAVRAIGVDWIDMPPDVETREYFDIHIAASHAGLEQVAKFIDHYKDGMRQGAVGRLVRHGSDPRLAKLVIPERTGPRLKLVYYGTASSTVCPDDLRNHINWLEYDHRDAEAGFARLVEFDMQYAVRPPVSSDLMKSRIHPFTKGVTAAVLCQNILVTRTTPDAVHYLGNDYPYLIDDCSNSSIQKGLRHAYETYGCQEWRRGLAIMEKVAAESTPEMVVKDLKVVLETAMDLTA